LEVFLLNQKEIEVAALAMRIFLVGLPFNFDADFHCTQPLVNALA
jgi:hypothetical protein